MDIKIINRALIKMGEKPISSLNEQPYGHLFELVYDDIRKNLISSYPWRFAIKRVKLSPLDEETLNDFEYKYNLPNDCLMVRGISDTYKFSDLRDFRSSSFERYTLEGKNIYTNINELLLIYVADVEKDFSPLFKEAFICKLAEELTVKIHQNPTLLNLFQQQYVEALSQAITHNEIIQDTQELGDNSWMMIREGWSNDY